VLQGVGGGVDIELGHTDGLRAAGYRADAITDSLIASLVNSQRADGRWARGPALPRPPIDDGDIGRTARAIIALATYGSPARAAELHARIARAEAWLETATPRTTADFSMRLLGLTWGGAQPAVIERAAAALRARQRPDGGWAGNRHLRSDAFATGQALYALCESGVAPRGDRTRARGIRFLRATQYPDGSWYVRSRAVKIQPYFQSGFPFDHDQWISAAATAWASTALADALRAGEGR
jgi:hypothetical protein